MVESFAKKTVVVGVESVGMWGGRPVKLGE